MEEPPAAGRGAKGGGRGGGRGARRRGGRGREGGREGEEAGCLSQAAPPWEARGITLGGAGRCSGAVGQPQRRRQRLRRRLRRGNDLLAVQRNRGRSAAVGLANSKPAARGLGL